MTLSMNSDFRCVLVFALVRAPLTTFAQTTGCSSSASSYLLPLASGATTRSLLTTGDMVGGYPMVGNPDGLGALDNGDGTFSIFMNHELSSSAGTTHAHGAAGAFVSKWTVNKSTLCVLSGQDLIQAVQLWGGTAHNPGITNFTRFCSADLPSIVAFYNAANGKGTLDRLFMNGEEGGTEGRVFGHLVTGSQAGTSYQLPHLGRANWENAVAQPLAKDKTVVMLMDDASPGQVYVYIGTKQNTGTPWSAPGC